MGLIDTHAHLDEERFDGDREQIINGLAAEGLELCITVADSMPSARATSAMAAQYPNIYAAVGVHPHNAKDVSTGDMQELEHLLLQKKVVALGEIGLDYHYDFSPRDIQKQVMLEQTELAMKLNKPVVFHVREAWGDFLELLRAGRIPHHAVVHSFSGSMETMRECLDYGMHISFTGIVTFKNAKHVKEAAAYVPQDRIMVETDCPFMTPEPFRGKRCEPKHVRYIAECIADLRGMDRQEFFRTTLENAKKFFNITE